MKRIAIISTGGTIEKTYNEMAGTLDNEASVLDILLASLELRGVTVTRIPLMNKDSLDMTHEDHVMIAANALRYASEYDGVIVVHGTDRLSISGQLVSDTPGTPDAPIVFTGAMRPYELRNTDATQNLTEALLAVQLLTPGVYLAMHNQVLSFPGVEKDYRQMTFVSK